MAVLDGGLDWKNVGISPDEAQFIATRGMQREDIATIWGVPPHFIGAMTSERSANLEQRFLEFLVTCLKPNLRRYEAELNAKLFSGIGRNANKFFAKFDTADFERADFATTLKAIQTGRYAGLYTIDEGRRLLGLNPVDPKTLNADNPGGSLWQPVNMQPITDGVLEIPTAPPTDQGVPQPGGEQVPPVKVEPGATPDATSDSRAFFTVFQPIFRDGLGRICARSKTDYKDFERVFMPILASVASTYAPTSGDMTMPESVAAVVRTHLTGMYKRSADWDKTNMQTLTADELTRALAVVIPAAKTFTDDEETND
jgi:hypothetical protein